MAKCESPKTSLHRLRVRNIMSMLIMMCLSLVSVDAFATFNEKSAGPMISLFAPTYGDFAEVVSTKGEDELPKNVLLMGGQATFIRKGFLTGGRLLTGSTKTQKGTSGSYYQMMEMGFLMGYGFDFGPFDMTFSSLLGHGMTTFSSATETAGGVMELTYLTVTPGAQIGVRFANTFKVSFGGAYQVGLIHKTNSYGAEIFDAKNQKVGGLHILIQLAFGDLL